MFKKLVSVFLTAIVICALTISSSAASTPDFVDEMPAPEHMLFSTATDKSLDLLSATVVLPQDFTYFMTVSDVVEKYGFTGDFYVQFDWSIDKCAWSFSKEWNDIDNKDAMTYKLTSDTIQTFDIFDLTLDSDLERFSQGIKLENDKNSFYYPEHELSIRARFIFVCTEGELDSEEALYSEWSEGFSVNDDYYNRVSRGINIIDMGMPAIVDKITYKKATDTVAARFSFDWYFDGNLEDTVFNLYAMNGGSLEIQEQICIGKDGTWTDIKTSVSDTPYSAGLETVEIDDSWTENGNYFKYRMRYFYPGDTPNNVMSFHSSWSDSIIYENGEFSLVNETDDLPGLEGETETEPASDSEEQTHVSPIVYIILIFVLLCFLFGILTSITETRRQKKEAMEKAGLVKKFYIKLKQKKTN